MCARACGRYIESAFAAKIINRQRAKGQVNEHGQYFRILGDEERCILHTEIQT